MAANANANRQSKKVGALSPPKKKTASLLVPPSQPEK
jgi:hypothetical protein